MKRENITVLEQSHLKLSKLAASQYYFPQMSVYTGVPVFIRATGSCKGHTKLRLPLLSGISMVKSMVHWFFSNEKLMPKDAPRSNAS